MHTNQHSLVVVIIIIIIIIIICVVVLEDPRGPMFKSLSLSLDHKVL